MPKSAFLLSGQFCVYGFYRRYFSAFLRHGLSGTEVFYYFRKIFICLWLLTLGLGFLEHHCGKIFKEYHYKRFLVFVNPDLDPAGKELQYPAISDSIGAGQFTGQGLAQASKTGATFCLPEDTDFIISHW